MNIIIKNLQKRIPVTPRVLSAIKKVVRQTLKKEIRSSSGEITICLVNDAHIRKFNREYLGKDNPTDVIAFDLAPRNLKSKGGIVADIAISTQTAISNARIFKTSYLYELLLYAAHGLLHILGSDDKNAKQSRAMQKKAEQILEKLKLNPVRKVGPRYKEVL